MIVLFLFFHFLEQAVSLGTAYAGGAHGEGLVLAVAVECGQHRTVNKLTVTEIDTTVFLGDRHVYDIVVLVEIEASHAAAALLGGGFQHLLQFSPIHRKL